MTPADKTRIWRKAQRKALRGIPTGRRTTHAPTPPVRSPWQGNASAPRNSAPVAAEVA